MRKVGEKGDALQEVELVLHLLDAGGLHDLLEHDPLHAPQLPVSDGLDGGCPLAVVEDGQFSKGLAHTKSAQHLPILDDFIFSLGRDVYVGPQLPCKKIFDPDSGSQYNFVPVGAQVKYSQSCAPV